MEKSTKNNFIVRTLSGLLMLAIVLGATLASPWTFALLVGVICVVSMWEFYDLAGKTGSQPNKWIGLALGLLALSTCYSILWAGSFAKIGIALSGLIAFSVIGIELFANKKNPLGNIAATLLGLFYIAIPLCLLMGISVIPTEQPTYSLYYPWNVLWFIFIIWMNDVGAYITGVSFGRHPLFERISPKKSWEGFFGGLTVGIATGVLAAIVMGWNVWFWIGLAVIAVITGVLGDLIESMFKRAAGVKDSGNLIPGHGGMLDRFDALLFSTPFVFTYFTIFA